MKKLLGTQANEVVSSVQSRLNPNKYRILIFIDSFAIPSAAQMNQLLCDFLNEMRNPPNDLGETENEAPFSYQWQIKEEQIYLLTPSFGFLPTGTCVEKWLRTQFDDKHKQAGFTDEFIALYNESLIVNSRRHVCIYSFNNYFLQEHLLPLAKTYYNQKFETENQEVHSKEQLQNMRFFANKENEAIVVKTQKNSFNVENQFKNEKR